MNADERDAILSALNRIPTSAWNAFLDTDSAAGLRARRDETRQALAALNHSSRESARRYAEDLIDVLGYRLLGDKTVGPWVREQLLRDLAATKWNRLAERYRTLCGESAATLHGNATQHGQGSATMASYWRRGTRWAHAFCEALELPEALAHRRVGVRVDDELVEPAVELGPLHDFQCEVQRRLARLLADGAGRAALVSLPTGAGKTRVAVEAICDRLSAQMGERQPRDVAVWIAQSEELLLQAWECFRLVWRSRHASMRLALVRGWGARDVDEIDLDEGPTVLLASIQQLHAWVRKPADLFEVIPRRRHVVTVIDEAHAAVAPSYGEVLVALGQRAKNHWQTLASAPPVVGLTATPWRSNDDESRRLRGYFQETLLTPRTLGARPIAALQERRILSRVTAESMKLGRAPELSPKESALLAQFGDLPATYLERLGRAPERNAAIVQRLLRCKESDCALVFACSVEHAALLARLLNRVSGRELAAAVSGHTPRAQRAAVIERFRNGELRFLCNVSVLTTGFDAPKANVVCMTRPTTSATLYEQMVGRGLRGPLNDGTARCLVLDAQDEGLPTEILSYARVRDLWDHP